MKVDKKQLQAGMLRITCENPDDIWALYCVLSTQDQVKMRSFRKVKVGSSERSQQVIKKPIVLSLLAEKITFEAENPSVKVLGIIQEGTDDVPKGAHHSFHIGVDDTITVTKQWEPYQLQKLNEAINAQVPATLLIVCDREKGIFAKLTRQGYDILKSIDGNIAKKYEGAGGGSQHVFGQLAEETKQLFAQHKFTGILIGAPSFWHSAVTEAFSILEKVPVQLATVTSADKNGIEELLRRPEARALLNEQRSLKEMALVDDLMAALHKEEPVTYGIQQCKQAAESGAIQALLVSEGFMQKRKEEDSFAEIEDLLRLVDQSKGEVHLISPSHEGGKKIDGLGGMAATLRFSIE